MKMWKVIGMLESYIMLVDEFAAGGKKINNRGICQKRKKKKRLFSALDSYRILVNEMGAGGKKNQSVFCKK